MDSEILKKLCCEQQVVWELINRKMSRKRVHLYCEHQKHLGLLMLVPFQGHFSRTGDGSFQKNYMWKHVKACVKCITRLWAFSHIHPPTTLLGTPANSYDYFRLQGEQSHHKQTAEDRKNINWSISNLQLSESVLTEASDSCCLTVVEPNTVSCCCSPPTSRFDMLCVLLYVSAH